MCVNIYDLVIDMTHTHIYTYISYIAQIDCIDGYLYSKTLLRASFEDEPDEEHLLSLKLKSMLCFLLLQCTSVFIY